MKRSTKNTKNTKNTKRKKKIIGVPPFLEGIQKGDKPKLPGKYIIYFSPVKNSAWSNTKIENGLDIACWNGEVWFYSVPILAFFGPIHILNSEKLENGKIVSQVFYTGTIKQISKKTYETGPHHVYFSAFCSEAKEKCFIFCFDTEYRFPYPIAKAKLINDEFKWVKLGEKAQEKYRKIIRKDYE